MEMIDTCTAVVDAGPLIHLDELGCLDLLADLSPLVVPDVVWREVQRHRPLLQLCQIPGLRALPADVQPSLELCTFVDTLGLDAGETAALALAEQAGIQVFLTDDSAARFAAESRGLRVHGTIGILIRAIRQGLRSRPEVLDLLSGIRERSTLHLAQSLLDQVTARVSED